MTLGIVFLSGFFEVCWVFFLLSNGSSIFCFYKSTVKQISCQSTMENKDHGVTSYPVIRAAMQYMGGGSVSPPQCKERLQSGGKSQPLVKSQNLWLHPAFPHSTSWINLWPCLCRAAARLRARLCLQPAKSLWGREVSLGLLTGGHQIAEGSHSWSQFW